MITPNAESLLRVWEENQRAHPLVRALSVLAAASPDTPSDVWRSAPVGDRDAGLMMLQERLFGAALSTTTACPECGERLESEFSVSDIRDTSAPLPGRADVRRLQCRDYAIDYRLPTSADVLEVVADAGHVADAPVRLLARCVSCVRRGDALVDPAALPQEVVAAITSDMAQHDPDGDVRMALDCPACRMTWQARFDIVTYFWGELDDWAQRTLAEVHCLARAYGWSESAILALSPTRRRAYLDMVSA